MFKLKNEANTHIYVIQIPVQTLTINKNKYSNKITLIFSPVTSDPGAHR